MEEFQAKVGLVAEVIKGSLENFNLYIAVDPKTEEFIFIDRDALDKKGPGKVARVKMGQINVRK